MHPPPTQFDAPFDEFLLRTHIELVSTSTEETCQKYPEFVRHLVDVWATSCRTIVFVRFELGGRFEVELRTGIMGNIRVIGIIRIMGDIWNTRI